MWVNWWHIPVAQYLDCATVLAWIHMAWIFRQAKDCWICSSEKLKNKKSFLCRCWCYWSVKSRYWRAIWNWSDWSHCTGIGWFVTHTVDRPWHWVTFSSLILLHQLNFLGFFEWYCTIMVMWVSVLERNQPHHNCVKDKKAQRDFTDHFKNTPDFLFCRLICGRKGNSFPCGGLQLDSWGYCIAVCPDWR